MKLPSHLLFLGLGLISYIGPAAAQNYVTSPEDRARIEAALPHEASARPLRSRRLLMFTLNVGYGGHPSIQYANQAFSRMGQQLRLYETEVSQDPAVFQPDSLRRFDAVCFNNTVGNCFTNAELRRSLLEFVTGGGGLLGFHGTTVAFTQWPGAIEDWPEFGFMIGARGANHRDSDEKVWLKVEDPQHPLTRVFAPDGFEFRDEYFRPQAPYSRDRVRVLLSIDVAKTDLTAGGAPRGATVRPDNDYAAAWIRNYGRGRIFYSTMAHNPYVFWNTNLLRFYLNAVQFALGDLPAPTTPSARLTPAMRVQEALHWRLGLETPVAPTLTLFESIEQAQPLELPYFGACSAQKVSADLPKRFDPELSDDDLGRVRLKLEAAGLRLLTYSLDVSPTESAAWRKVFDFGRKMGIETLICNVQPEALDLIEKLADEFGIQVALRSGRRGTAAGDMKPASLLHLCRQRSPRVGVCVDLETWRSKGINPVVGVRTLGDRLFMLRLRDFTNKSSSASETAWGKGVMPVAAVLHEVERQGLKPTLFSLECPDKDPATLSQLRESIEFFNRTTMALRRF